MILLYGLLILILFCTLSLLVVPYYAKQAVFTRSFLFVGLFTAIFSLGLYQFSSNPAALKQWLTQGKQHYQLQEEINNLGGFPEIIKRIKQKLAANPDDAEGWFILGKLYLANQQYDEAKDALAKAHQLKPQDEQIKHFYDLAAQH